MREHAVHQLSPEGDKMEARWHFGYNCSNYLPALQKCRVLVDMYSKREDLLREKWLTSREILGYTGASPSKLLLAVHNGSIRWKRLKSDGSLRFRVLAPWDWDACPLRDSGGQCLHFEPHGGRHITCLMDLESSTWEHPNVTNVPSVETIESFESAVLCPGGRLIQSVPLGEGFNGEGGIL